MDLLQLLLLSIKIQNIIDTPSEPIAGLLENIKYIDNCSNTWLLDKI